MDPVCPKKAVTQMCRCLDFMVSIAKGLSPGQLFLADISAPMLMSWTGGSTMLASSFVPREEMLPLPDTPRRGNVSSSVSLGILRSCCPLPGFCSPSPQEYHYTHWAPPQQGLGLLKRQALSSTVCKNLSLSAHLFLLCQQFQRSFLVQVMLSVYTHTLSLSFLSLSSSGLPLLHSTCDSTPSYISAFTTFHSVVSFLPQVVQFFFSVLRLISQVFRMI